VHDNFVRGRVVRFPTKPEPPESSPLLEEALREHIRRYVSLPDDDLAVVVAFVLCSWQSHRFETVPYLHVMGAPGSGKSRLLRVLADVCYRGIGLGASSSLSSLFRILDTFRGTLALDEADFQSNRAAHEEVLRVLREGFQRGTLLTRTEGGHENWTTRAFDVFGPKVIAGLKPFPDLALESRSVPIVMQLAVGPGRYPDRLPADYEQRAAELRNVLLGWRLKTYFEAVEVPELPGLEGRPKQVYGPLIAVSSDESRVSLCEKAQRAQAELREERQDSEDGVVLAAMCELARGRSSEGPARIYLQDVVEHLGRSPKMGELPGIKAKDVAQVCRMLGLEPIKDGKGRYVNFNPTEHADALKVFGLGGGEPAEAA
jgi:hypothetical protein